MLSGDFKKQLESRLASCGLSWEESGKYLKGVLDVGDGRTQVFLVDTNIDQFCNYQDHDILSPICRVADQEARVRSVALSLLEFTGKQKVGHVAIINGILVYKADCSIDAPAEVFGTLLRTVCKMADTLEKILTEGLDAYRGRIMRIARVLRQLCRLSVRGLRGSWMNLGLTCPP